jgi:hypothetical protein
MLLHNDEARRLNGTHSFSSAAMSGNRTSLRLMPAPLVRTEGLPNEALDQCVLRRGDYSIRLADSPGRNSEVSALVKRMYSWRGYNTENTAAPPSQTTLEAFNGEDLVGTLSLRLDSEHGLLADELYKEKISTFRAKDRKVCELSKLAIDPQFSSKELLASLFNLAYICGRIIHKATDFFIEVNPRHTGYYKRMLGFRQLGETCNCRRVNAPAVLLHLELDYVDAQVSCLAGLHEPRERSLYPYYLTEHEEKKVAKRINHINQVTAFDFAALYG